MPHNRRSYGGWAIPGCSDSDQWGWQVNSDAYVTQNYGINLQNYDMM